MEREKIQEIFKTLKRKIAEHEAKLYAEGLKCKNGILEKRNGNVILRRRVGRVTTLMV